VNNHNIKAIPAHIQPETESRIKVTPEASLSLTHTHTHTNGLENRGNEKEEQYLAIHFRSTS